eukprot:TRINITY_DN65_c0_g1_i3.p1 TRINITY_DN65_c0_g1~~TRINITY_DN65_c0_g1_i3.p1  ORF type:complete len:350 (-),score=239.32 TRINITY_DN65_c0_g1_i3:50-1099(-)
MEGALEISVVVERRVNALMNLHDQYLEINKKYQEEARALERKYQTLYTPIFDKRESIVTGKYEPTEEEAKYGEQEEEEKKDERPKGDEKGIPDFWSQALQNDSFLSRSIFDADNEALEYLTDIRVNNFETNETNGFELVFTFAENPYFTNKTLTKKYFLEMDDMFGEFNLEHAEGCTIDWKSGKNLAVKLVKKKVKSKGKSKKTGAAKTVQVSEPCETFFNFFTPPKADDKDEEDDEDDEEGGEEDEQQQLMEIDFEMGCKIKDLVPIAVLWFTGDAAEFDEDAFDFGGFGDEDDEDIDEEEEDDEEDDEPKGRGGRAGKGGKGHAFAPPPNKAGSNIPQPQQPECKQQ